MPSYADDLRGSSARTRAFVFAFVAGLAITIVEFSAVRLFAPFFGQSPLVWANVIGVVLLSLAIGYAAGGRLAERGRSFEDLRHATLLASLSIAIAPYLGPRCARWLLPEGFATGPDLGAAGLASFVATIVVFAIPLACLGALSPLLQRATSGNAPVGRFAGLTMAISTLGAVVGGYLTTLLLLPTLGTRLTLLGCAATMGAASALLGIGKSTLPILLVIACGFAAPELHAPSKGAGLPGDRVLLERDSPMQCVRLLERREHPPWLPGESFLTRILALDEGDAEYHSVRVEGRSDTLGRYYDVFALLPRLLDDPRERLEVLILGFAGGTGFRVLARASGPNLRVTGVEIDPLVLEVAHDFLDVPREDPRLNLVCADARVFVRGLDHDVRFDIVIVDCFAQQQYVPFHLATVEFFREVRDHLARDGVLAMNLDARRATARLPNSIASSVRAAGFGSVLLLPLPAYPSEILIARVSPAAPWLPATLPDPPFAEVTFAAWSRRRTVSSNPSAPLLTDDRAPIERLIEESLATGNEGR